MFSYYVALSFGVLPRLVGEKLKDMYLKPEVAARCYTEGVGIARNIYGDKIHYPAPAVPPISYIHLSALGAKIQFPEDDGEPNARPAGFPCIDEAIERVEEPVDFAACEWVTHRQDFAKRLGGILDKNIAPSLGLEGPITTAVLLYGNGFYAELLAEPEKSMRFLEAITDSIIEFTRFVRGSFEVGGSHGICDDLSSLISPGMWPEFVLPFWNRIYEAFTNDGRHLHCENLSEGHLPLLNRLGLSFFDPSHAPLLRPSMLKKHLQMPWQWRVQSVHVIDGFDRIRREMEDAVESGASRIPLYACYIGEKCVSPQHIDFFIKTAGELGGKPA
jgi:hypothetical protein